MKELDFIFSRRSIRRFTAEKVSNPQIRLLLEAAMAAPSAMNTQPWHFLVIDDPVKLAELRKILPFGKNGCASSDQCLRKYAVDQKTRSGAFLGSGLQRSH